MTEGTGYTLVFEGVKDDSPDTLRLIKGVMLADLEFPVEDILRFLNEAPICIKTAESVDGLEPARALLDRAGAKVLILGPAGEPAQGEDEVIEEIDVELDDALIQNAVESIDDEDDEKVYVIDEESTDLSSILEEMCTEVPSGGVPAAQQVSDPIPDTPASSQLAEAAPPESAPVIPVSDAPSLGALELSLDDAPIFPAPAAPVTPPAAAPPAPVTFALDAVETAPPAPQKTAATAAPSTPTPAAQAAAPAPKAEKSAADRELDFSLESLSEGLSLALKTGDGELPLLDSALSHADEPIAKQHHHEEQKSSDDSTQSDSGPVEQLKSAAAPAVDSGSEFTIAPETPPHEERPAMVEKKPVRQQAAPPVEAKPEPAPAQKLPPIPDQGPKIKITAADLLIDDEPGAEAAPPPEAEKVAPPAPAPEPAPAVTLSTEGHAQPEPAAQAPPTAPDASPNAERTSAPASIEMVPVRGKRKLPAGLGVGVSIVMGAIVLGIGNWLYFSASDPEPVSERATDADEISRQAALKRHEVKKRRDEEAAKPAFTEEKLSGTFASYGDAAEISLVRMGPDLREISFTVTTEKPPELSHDEIAKGVLPRPWLRRTESKEFTVKPGENGAFTAVALARSYLEVGTAYERVVSRIELQGTLPQPGNPLRVRFEVRHGIPDDQPITERKVLNNGPEGYQVALSGEVTLGAVAVVQEGAAAGEAPAGEGAEAAPETEVADAAAPEVKAEVAVEAAAPVAAESSPAAVDPQ